MRTMVLGLVLLALAAAVPSARAQSVVVDPAYDALKRSVLNALNADPVTHGQYVQVDTYDGLVILHGWTLNKNIRQAINKRVQQVPGVAAVFDYIVFDQTEAEEMEREIGMADRIQISMTNSNDRVFDRGTPTGRGGMPRATTPDELALTVKYALGNEPYTGIYEITVENYNGIIVLHGLAPNDTFARNAESIAAQVWGVRRVFSYLQTEEMATPAEQDWPLVVELNHEPKPVQRGLPEQPFYVEYEKPCAPCGR